MRICLLRFPARGHKIPYLFSDMQSVSRLRRSRRPSLQSSLHLDRDPNGRSRVRDMSVNSSNASFFPLSYHCFNMRDSVFHFTAYVVTLGVLLLPLSALVLHLGLGRRRRRSSRATSHSDVFTYNLVALELMVFAAYVVFLCGVYARDLPVSDAAFFLVNMLFPVKLWFHILACVDRYLAVVHPITYQRLRHMTGVRIRNVGIPCVCLLLLVWSGVMALDVLFPYVSFLCILVVSLVVVTFSSFCVLRVLLSPAPGGAGADGERVDRRKQRALCVMAAVVVTLWLWLLGFLVGVIVEEAKVLSGRDGCTVLMAGLWFGLPNSLVLPLLFLHRARQRPVQG